MARDFFLQFAASRDTFAEASDALGLDVAALCFEDHPRLDLTEFAQPAILTAEIAMLRPLLQEFGLSATHFGGHSLGEYTALAAAGVLSLTTAVRLVRTRGALLQMAVPVGVGAMAALTCDGIANRDLLVELDVSDVDVANRNSVNQIVLSGAKEAVEQVCARTKALFSRTELDVVMLNVSAPFHSRLMRVIEPTFSKALCEVEMHASKAGCVTSNWAGRFHAPERGAIVAALIGQISGTVDWVANMRALCEVAPVIYEVGPNRPLQRFFGSIDRKITSIVSVRAAEKAFSKAAGTKGQPS